MPKVTIIIQADDIDEMYQSDKDGSITSEVTIKLDGSMPALVMSLVEAIEKEPKLASIFMSAAMTYTANEGIRKAKQEHKVRKVKLSNSDLN